jgi:hypothetical protein
VAAGVTATLIGSFRYSSAREAIVRGIVAENSSV